MIERAIRADPVQPRSEGGAAVETANFAPCFQKGLLRDIFGVDGISRHTAGQLEHRAAMALYERTKGVTVTATRIFDGGIIAPVHQAVSLDCDAGPGLVGKRNDFRGGGGYDRAEPARS